MRSTIKRRWLTLLPDETVLDRYRGKKGEEYQAKKHAVPENRYMWVAREQAQENPTVHFVERSRPRVRGWNWKEFGGASMQGKDWV